MKDLEFKEVYHKDAGPIVRWVATRILGLLHMIEKPLHNYALMYEAVWEDEEDDFSVPHNQMVLELDDEDYV